MNHIIKFNEHSSEKTRVLLFRIYGDDSKVINISDDDYQNLLPFKQDLLMGNLDKLPEDLYDLVYSLEEKAVEILQKDIPEHFDIEISLC